MRKTKAEFINDILTNKRLDLPLKEKLIELTSKELLNAENENRKRIEELEERIRDFNKKKSFITNEIEGKNNSRLSQNENSNADNSNQKEHKPKDVAEFLFNFRRVKNPRLKFLTHKWDLTQDTPLTYEFVIKNAIDEFWECAKKYTIPTTLFSKILEFVYAKSGKDEKGNPHPHFFYLDENVKRINIYKGWSSDEMRNWAKINSNKDPNGDEYWIRELINPFKNCIEVRAKTLKKHLNDSINHIYNDSGSKLELILDKSLDDARFFTDVPVLFEGIREILSAAKTFAEENNMNPYIKISYDTPEGTGNYGIRQITIITSKNIDVTNSFEPKSGGNFGAAFTHFWGLCNWSIICKQNEKLIKYNVISDEENIIEKEILEHFEPEGFTHLLTFFAL